MVDSMEGGDESALQLSCLNNSKLPVMEAVPNYQSYPSPVTTYEEIVVSRELFMDTLKKLHAAMATKFMIPVVGGKDLDLYKLFIEVTSRGGINKVMKEKRWKEITATFSFPSSATNASFVLRKYYVQLLYHFEQIYFFKAKYWTPSSTDATQSTSTIMGPPNEFAENQLSVLQQVNEASPQPRANTTVPEVSSASAAVAVAAGSQVCGVIDGKFESGYLITVKIGSEEFKGVLYQVTPSNEAQMGPVNTTNHTLTKLGVPRRKRRKKCEIRKRDPAHPKPNRSGYNFFFAEQHARLKPLYYGRDREISRLIGELWNKLQEPERAVYQEKALRDKERYKMEMEDYRERLNSGHMTKNVVPVHHCSPVPDSDVNLEFEDTTPVYNEENEDVSDKSDMEDDESADKDLDIGEYPQADAELKNVNIEVLANEAFKLQTGLDNIGSDERSILSPVYAEEGISVPIEEVLVKSSNVGEQVSNP